MTARVLFVLSLLSVAAARAQTPIGPPRTDLASNPGSNVLGSVAVDGQGNVILLWQELRAHKAYGRRFSEAGVPMGAGFQVSRRTTSPQAAANERGDTVMIWDQASQGGGDEVIVRRLHPGLPQLTVRADRGRGALLRLAADVDVDRNGRFVAVWAEAETGSHLHARRFNADGSYQGPEITVTAPGLQLDSRVAMNPATGDFLIVWTTSPIAGPVRILGQRFRFSSGPLGSPFQINTTAVGELSLPEAGCAVDGSCVVVWRKYPGRNRPGDVLFQRFDPDGKKKGGETLVGKIPRFGGHGTLAVAPQGDFVVAWADATSSPSARFRLFRSDGTPAGPEVPLTATEFPSSPELAFGWDGTFVVAWTDLIGTIEDQTWEIDYQRFEVPPGLD